jgi:hypothetical protein
MLLAIAAAIAALVASISLMPGASAQFIVSPHADCPCRAWTEQELRLALADGQDPLHEEAIVQMKAISSGYPELVKSMLGASILDVRLAAINALGNIGDQSAIDLLESIKQDPHRTTAEGIAAAQALAFLKIGTTRPSGLDSLNVESTRRYLVDSAASGVRRELIVLGPRHGRPVMFERSCHSGHLSWDGVAPTFLLDDVRGMRLTDDSLHVDIALTPAEQRNVCEQLACAWSLGQVGSIETPQRLVFTFRNRSALNLDRDKDDFVLWSPSDLWEMPGALRSKTLASYLDELLARSAVPPGK